MTVAIILFLLFFVLFLGVPIAFGLGSIGLGLMLFGDISPLMIPQTFYSVADNFILLAVPMFLMMSNILLKAGVGEDLFNFAQSWVGNLFILCACSSLFQIRRPDSRIRFYSYVF